MSDDPELKAALFLLQDFLREERRRQDRGITLEGVYDAVQNVGAKVDAHRRQQDIMIREQIEHGLRLNRYGAEIRRIKRAVFPPPGDGNENTPTGQGPSPVHGSQAFHLDEETTGNFRVEEAKRAVEIAELRKRAELQEHEKRESGIWWRRQRFLWVAAAAFTLFAGAITIAGGLFVAWLTRGAH